MLRPAVRRIVVLTAGLLAGTAGVSALLGAAAGAGLERAVSVGFYILGAALLVGCFVFGVKGPLRGVSQTGEPAPLVGARGVRRATADERSDAARTAVLLFVLGMLVIVIGSLIDPLHRTF